MKFWTWDRQRGRHLRSEDQCTVFYLRLPSGQWVFWPNSQHDDVLVQVPGHRYPLTRKQYGDIVAPPPPAPTPINWKSVPGYSLSSGDFLIDGGYYRNESLASALQGGRDTPGTIRVRGAVIETRGSLYSGFRGRFDIENCLIRILPTTEAGKADRRCINAEELVSGRFVRNTIIGGGGNFASGLNGVAYGDWRKGEGLVSYGNRQIDILGHYRNADGSLIRSNWSQLHAGHDSFKGMPGAVVGWDVRQFWQLSRMVRGFIHIEWNEVLNRLGMSHHEDLISLLYGSGGPPELIAQIRNNLLVTSGGIDWAYVPGVSAAYNPSNQVVTADMQGPQGPSYTRNSQTSIIVGDQKRDLYADNVTNANFEGNDCLGPRGYINVDHAHHVTFRKNGVYQTDRHPDGTPYTGYFEAAWQGGRSTDVSADGKIITGFNTYQENVESRPGHVEGAALNLPTHNGSTSVGNTRRAFQTDGGASVIAAYRARAQAAGVVIGSSLTPPPAWGDLAATPF